MSLTWRAVWVSLMTVFLCTDSAIAAAANKVVIAYSSLNERGAGALLVARDQGFFRKQDLDVQLIFMRSGAVALSALSSGEAQFYSGSANGSALGAMAGGLDLVFVAGLANKLNGTMMAAPTIHSPADLKGKNIAIQSIGGGVWMITQLVLEHWRLDPKRDGINLRIVGDESVMVQSLMIGTVDATYTGYAYSTMLKKQGFRLLADLTKLGVPFSEHGDSGAAKLSEWISGNGGESCPRADRSDRVYPAAGQQAGGHRHPDQKFTNCAVRGSRRRLRGR